MKMLVITRISFLISLVTAQFNPHFKSNRNVIVHLFEWKFNDVANECEDFLGPKGFAAVQVSPVNENLIVKGDYENRPWWERYHPMSYKIQTRSGNEDEFLDMSLRCNKAGIRIYVDVVFNHMAASTNKMIGTSNSKANGIAMNYPGVPYKKDDFHKPCTIQNYDDAHEIRNCQLGTRPDIDHSHESVQVKIVNYLNRLIDLGAAGFRIDAAKYIWPIDLQNIYERIKNLNTSFDFPEESRPFIYQEVIDLGNEAISKTEYSGFGVVTEFLHSTKIGRIFNGYAPLSTLINWGPTVGFLQHEEALVFVDNHNNQRGDSTGGDMILTYKQPKKYLMAITFMLAHPYGIPRIMSSFDFQNSDQGPPSDEDDNIISPTFDNNGQCVNAWICEHRWTAISNMVEFRNNVEGQPVINWQENGPNQISFCRGNKGFIAFNNDPESSYISTVFACLKPGVYCDVISGYKTDLGCSGRTITICDDGFTNISIPFNVGQGVIAIHEKSKL